MRISLERVAAVISGLTILLLVSYLLIRNQPLASPQLFFALRILVSSLAAILGATIQGFLNLKWSGNGLAVRAGGALALFVLTFVITPKLEFKNDGQKIVGDQNGIVVGHDNNGQITLNPAPHSGPCRDKAHGVESYGRSFVEVVTSPEMGGGHNQDEWCNTAMLSLAGKYPGGHFAKKSSSETSQNHCSPFNCPQYTYTCNINVDAEPIYKLAKGPECP